MKRVVICVVIMMMSLTACQRSQKTVSQTEVTEEVQTEVTEEVQRGKLRIKSLEDIDGAIALMTLDEKAGQLIQAERGGIELSEITQYNIGSILSGGGSVPSPNTPEGWVSLTNDMQEASRNSSTGIPIIYGIDAVHGNGNVEDVTVFPHNIGLGAANDPALMEAIGRATAKEVAAIGVQWNFAPAVSCVQDIRWGRSYESYSEDIDLVSSLSVPYIIGLQAEGVMATTKHFIGDGTTTFGLGEGENLIDRGDVTIGMENMLELNLPAYEAAIAAGTKSIMASYNSVDGLKVHGDDYLLRSVLRDQLGFEGLLVSDWEAIHTIAPTLIEQVAISINAGVDLLMQPYNWKEVHEAIVENVMNDVISEERLNEAVRRNLVFKYEAGLFVEGYTNKSDLVGSADNKAIARQAVAKSIVLLENNGILPLRKDTKIYLLGPASDNVGIQSGGWTRQWQGDMSPDLNNGISLKDAFQTVLTANGGALVDTAEEADLVVLAIGEKPYAEMLGDTADLSLDGPLSLPDNMAALEEAAKTGKPLVTVIIAGRPLLLENYMDEWDALMMAWLPGTEGNGMTDVLFGDASPTGKLPVTWPMTNDQAGDSVNMDDYQLVEHQYKFGYGLTY